MNKIYISLLLVAGVALTACTPKNPKREKIANGVANMNDKCPIRIDSLLVMDSVSYDKEKNVYTYYQTFEGIALEPENLEKIKTGAHDNLKESIKNDLNIKTLKDEGVTLVYKFYGNGKQLFTETFKKGDY